MCQWLIMTQEHRVVGFSQEVVVLGEQAELYFISWC